VNHFAIPQNCKLIEVFYCWGYEMVVHVVEWEWIFGVLVWMIMGKVELRSNEGDIDVVVEVNGMGNIDDGIEDREGKIEDMVDFLCRAFAKFVAKIDFEVGIEMAKVSKVGFEVGIEMPKVAKARVFSNYLEIVVHNLETVHKDIASYWVDEAAIVLLEFPLDMCLHVSQISSNDNWYTSPLLMRSRRSIHSSLIVLSKRVFSVSDPKIFIFF
jgi:hypothetical protein